MPYKPGTIAPQDTKNSKNSKFFGIDNESFGQKKVTRFITMLISEQNQFKFNVKTFIYFLFLFFVLQKFTWENQSTASFTITKSGEDPKKYF